MGIIKKHKISFMVAIVLLIGGVFTLSYFTQTNASEETKVIPTKKTNIPLPIDEQTGSTAKTYETINPTIATEQNTLRLVGTVLSNETAVVYARRGGIIKDLYVDIGDTVSENQKIGLLLPPGVAGQSNANIFEKQVKLEEAKANLEHTSNVAQQVVEKVELDLEQRKLDEKKATPTGQVIKKIEVGIESTERDLAQIQESNKEVLAAIKEDISQTKEQTQVLVKTSLETIEHIFLGGQHNGPSSLESIRSGLGVRNSSSKNIAIDAYRKLRNKNIESLNLPSFSTEEIYQVLGETSTTIESILRMLDTSMPGNGLTQNEIEDFTQKLLGKQTALLKAKEKLQDLLNKEKVTIETQTQQIIKLENMLAQGKAQLSETSTAFQANVEKAEQEVSLVKAQQELNIQKQRNNIAIANARLQQEYAKSGNESLTSPFKGTVSKRFVNAGDMVTMSTPLFELVDVETTLAKKAKREIQFGLPEEFHAGLTIGDAVVFSLPDDDVNTYTGTITRKSPQIDEKTHTVTVQMKIDDSLVLPHHSRVNVTVPLKQASQFQIPSATLMFIDGESFVYILDEESDIPLRQKVTVIAEDGEYTDIQGDITADTLIITNKGDITKPE